MADPKEALASPDYLNTTLKRAAGVRRLNRVPVFIVAGIVSLVMAVVGYTMYQKKGAGTHSVGGTQKESDAPPSAAEPQVLKGAQDRGLIAAGAPPAGIDSAGDLNALPPPVLPSGHGPIPGVPSDEGSSGATPRNQAADQLRARLEQFELQRVEDRIKAQQADAPVEAKDPSQAQMTSAPDTTSQSPLSNTLARARDQMTDANALAGAALGRDSSGSTAARGGLNAANGQSAKRDFLNAEPLASEYLHYGRVAPLSPYEVKAGTVIPANMIGGINSELPGLLLAQVSENVYDSATGRYLLIPQGSKLIGTYDNGVTFGQSRVLVGWQRIIYPDGSSIDLGRMPGADQSGYAGFKDKVNNHLFRLFSEALLLSIFSAGVQLGQPQASSGSNYNSSQIVAAAIAGQMGELGMEIVRRNMDVAPTLEIRPGYSFNVMVTKDMVVSPWAAAQGPALRDPSR